MEDYTKVTDLFRSNKMQIEGGKSSKMERIIIIGGNGSGKTTFARILSEKLNLPLVHLDTLFWRDNWEHASQEEFDALMLKELNKPHWIIDGNFGRTIATRLHYCDTAIYFDFSSLNCLWGVITRVIKNYGKSRSDMGGYCPEKIDLKFYKNVWNFNKTNRKRYYEMLDNVKNVKVIILQNRGQVKTFLSSLAEMQDV